MKLSYLYGDRYLNQAAAALIFPLLLRLRLRYLNLEATISIPPTFGYFTNDFYALSLISSAKPAVIVPRIKDFFKGQNNHLLHKLLAILISFMLLYTYNPYIVTQHGYIIRRVLLYFCLSYNGIVLLLYNVVNGFEYRAVEPRESTALAAEERADRSPPGSKPGIQCRQTTRLYTKWQKAWESNPSTSSQNQGA